MDTNGDMNRSGGRMNKVSIFYVAQELIMPEQSKYGEIRTRVYCIYSYKRYQLNKLIQKLKRRKNTKRVYIQREVTPEEQEREMMETLMSVLK